MHQRDGVDNASMSENPKVNLNQYNNDWYDPGAGTLKRLTWFLVNACVIQSRWIPSSGLRVFFLKLFGAKIGQQVVIKPGVNVKYPWYVEIGDHVWIGEEVWLDSLAPITVSSHCCISQGAYLCTGNHDWSDVAFGLIVKPIALENGSWVGARATVLPGVTIGEHAILTAGSVASSDLPARQICRGNPAVPVKERVIKSGDGSSD